MAADYTVNFATAKQESFNATLEISDHEETDALLYYDSNKKRAGGGSFLGKFKRDKEDKKPKPTQSSWNERLGFGFNKIWLFRIALRCGYSRIHTTWYH